MDDIENRLDAIERLLARVMAAITHPAQVQEELDQVLPSAQYSLSPEEAGLLPHLERILDLVRQIQSAQRSSEEE